MSAVVTGTGSAGPTTRRTPPVRGAAWASLAQGLSIFVPLVVLGSAIGWPASLSDPASVALPRLLENEGAVRFGYLAYLLYSVLFGVTVVLLLRLVEDHLPPAARRVAVAFAIASVVARCIGIVRWLAPMPVLARAYDGAADDGQRYAVTQVYDALNSWGGTIGEALGVGLFAAVALGVLAGGLLRDPSVPRWLAVWGAVAAVAVGLNAVELVGVDLGPVITASVTVVQLWFVATAVWLLRRGAPSARTVRSAP